MNVHIRYHNQDKNSKLRTKSVYNKQRNICYWFLSLNLGILLITSWWSSRRLKKHSFFRGLISGRADYPLISQQRKTQDLLKNKALFIIKIKVLIWQLAQRCALYIQSRLSTFDVTPLISSWQVELVSCVQRQDSFQVLLESLATDPPRHYFQALKKNDINCVI